MNSNNKAILCTVGLILCIWLLSFDEDYSDSSRPIIQTHNNNQYENVDLDFVRTLGAAKTSFCTNFSEPHNLQQVTCDNRTLKDRLIFALMMENCIIAQGSHKSAMLVAKKLRKLAASNQFVFFRGADGLFNYNMVCNEGATPKFDEPVVISNGDCHPENFGTMVQANDRLVWGINDFDQGFNAPFTWDVKRGATGFLVACMSGNYSPSVCTLIAEYFLIAYTNFYTKDNACSVSNQERFIEGSKLTKSHSVINKLIEKGRSRDNKKKTKKWFKKKGVNYKREKFRETSEVKPIHNKSEIALFQEAIDAYLYHGTAAAAKFPNAKGFYKVLDVAEKLGSGTGSIGLNRFYLLIKGRRKGMGNIILEMKEQTKSILENFFSHHIPKDQEAKRAVDSETAAFPYANVFYGWTRLKGKPYIIREKSKHQVSLDMNDLYENKTLNDGYNYKFYEMMQTTDDHHTSKEENLTHIRTAARVYAVYDSKEREEAIKSTRKHTLLQELSDYADSAGTALAIYHSRARCMDYDCKLSQLSLIDEDTCFNIKSYLKTRNHKNFITKVLQFAIAETMREEHSWRLLKSLVQEHTKLNESVLKILTT